jgi:hypothetical protein
VGTHGVLVHNSCGSAASSGGETFYRSMSQSHFDEMGKTGKVPATGETFVSPSKSYAQQYNGPTVEINVKAGTRSNLAGIGVRNNGPGVSSEFPNMPQVQSGWARSSAYFKQEGDIINIGLGQGSALDMFNEAITGFRQVL